MIEMNAGNAIKKTFQKEISGEKTEDYDYKSLYRQRLIEFRREPLAVARVEKPLNIPRAKELGYKAKQGYVVVRVRVRKGSGMHTRPKKGRKPRRMGIKKLTRNISIKSMAEQKASKKYPNCEVLNSYLVGQDGKSKYYEVILIDTAHPSVKNDKKTKWLSTEKHKGRAERGRTSAGKKGRGLRNKGKGAEKLRPSKRAVFNKKNSKN